MLCSRHPLLLGLSILALEAGAYSPWSGAVQDHALSRMPSHAVSRMPSQAHQTHLSCHFSRRGICSGAFALAAWTPSADASGGATAGKTTSIPRAKIRYYGRMSLVLNGFNALGKAIESGDSDRIKKAKSTFFADNVDESPICELKSAGYLLAVAFKIDSKIPPDKIQAVKLYRSMIADVEKLGKELAGGKADKAAKAYAAAKDSMNNYLDEVELPPLTDPRYNDPERACFFKCEEA